MATARLTLAAQWTRILVILRELGRRRAICVVLFACIGFGGGLTVGVVRGTPLPSVHDEFSYLLAGDTFAQGRLTNPTHPHWEHFESFHIIHQPTYQSKYPPGQGLFLSLGEVLTRKPAVGVWISGGLMAAAAGWALLVWLPPAWGVLAGLMFTAQLTWFSYWAQSYWGGNVAALGGALAFGSFRALLDRPRWTYGAILGAGLGIMAASRPFEGAVVGGLLCGSLLVSAYDTSWARAKTLVLRGGLGAAFVLLPAMAALAHYNARVTGSLFTMPYQVHEAQYAAAPTFLLQSPARTPSYRHAELERYWSTWGRERHERLRNTPLLVQHVWQQLVARAVFLLGASVVALLGLLGVVHRRNFSEAAHRKGFGSALTVLLIVVAISSATKGAYSHYVAPIVVVLWVAVGAGLLGFHRRARRRRSLNLATVIVFLFAVTTTFNASRVLSSPPTGFALDRARVLETLQEAPGRHLVLVRYQDGHNVHNEWVYNEATIDHASVVWARSMGSANDSELLEYFSDRVTWYLDVGRDVRLQLRE